MEQNKIRTYFFYALGEIALVMIGILLALQVNNWNEERKQKELQAELLTELKENLIASRIEIKDALEFNAFTLTNLNTVLNYLETEAPEDSVIRSSIFYFQNWAIPYITTTAYESMKNHELFDFGNDSLKAAIARIYDERFTYLSSDYDRAEWQISAEVRIPASKQYLRYTEDQTVEIINYEAMLKDEVFHNAVTHTIRIRNWGQSEQTDILKEVDTLLESIEIQLERMD